MIKYDPHVTHQDRKSTRTTWLALLGGIQDFWKLSLCSGHLKVRTQSEADIDKNQGNTSVYVLYLVLCLVSYSILIIVYLQIVFFLSGAKIKISISSVTILLSHIQPVPVTCSPSKKWSCPQTCSGLDFSWVRSEKEPTRDTGFFFLIVVWTRCRLDLSACKTRKYGFNAFISGWNNKESGSYLVFNSVLM